MNPSSMPQQNVARGWLRLLLTAAVVWILLAVFGQLFAGNIQP
jgi:hypothetical protein